MSTRHAITVMIVEDHPLFREGLQSAISLEDDLDVIASYATSEDALSNVDALRPDVVLLDVNLPTMNGLQATRLLKARPHPPAVIVLTAYHDAEQVLHAMRVGASAYCAKDIEPENLVEHIRAVAAGYYIVNGQRMDWQTVQRWIYRGVNAMSPYAVDPDEHYSPLSPREMEILQFITNGMSNKEVAQKLQISQQTVKNHMTSILRKLNVQDRTQAAVTALRHGWVRLQIEGAPLPLPDDED